MGCSVWGLLGLLSLMTVPRPGQLQGLTVEPGWATFFTGEFVTFKCDIGGKDADRWFYAFYKDNLEYYSYSSTKSFTSPRLSTDLSGTYHCRVYDSYTRDTIYSHSVSLTVSDANVILQHPVAILYQGETAPLRCRHRYQADLTTAAFYRDGSPIVTDPGQRTLVTLENAVEISVQLLSNSSYTCKLNMDRESQRIRPILQPNRPMAQLRKREAQAGGSVTLTCSAVTPGWKFFWYRGKKTGDSLTAPDVAFLSNDRISASQAGVYRCRGGRGNPVYYTEYSSPIVTSRAVVVLQPHWPEIYYGEALTLRCQIEGGEDFEWEYEWTVPNDYAAGVQSRDEYRISYATWHHSGSYKCLGRMKNETSTTTWSNAFRLSVSPSKVQPALTVSPSWLSPGDSVTLNCSIKHPRAGWRFYWYKAIPDLSISFYQMEPLPRSTNGTERSYFIVHGQTETAGYSCKAARGSPLSFTHSSQTKFVWSGDFGSAVSLSVRPDQAQHFIRDTASLSLRCAGDSSAWTVNRFSSGGYLTRCASWGSMTGPTCNLNGSQINDGVYWCETATGRFSNAVNITGSYDNAIVVFPAQPVTEGQPVTLRCKLKTQPKLGDVYFYKDGKIIHNDTRGELVIPAVSKADEGFYKCARKAPMQRTASRASPESWMSVKAPPRQPSSSPFPVWWTAGLVCGVTLVLFLLFLSLYAKSKKWRTSRSPNADRSSATDHKIDLEEEAPRTDSPPPKDDRSEVTYSMIVLKKVCVSAEEGESPEGSTEPRNFKDTTRLTGRPNPEESAVYSNVVIRTTAGKSQPAGEDKTVYSEVRKNL